MNGHRRGRDPDRGQWGRADASSRIRPLRAGRRAGRAERPSLGVVALRPPMPPDSGDAMHGFDDASEMNAVSIGDCWI